MDFDFNIILVPLTLFLGAIWLLDKLWWSRRQSASSIVKHPSNSLDTSQAQKNLQARKLAYQQALQRHGYDSSQQDVDTDLAVTQSGPLPSDVLQAQREYREAKRQVNAVGTEQLTSSDSDNVLVRWARDYFPVLAIVLIVRSFIIEPFNIPSSSMVPTLYTGDFVAVNKYAYGIRLPLTYNKVIDTGSPEHGDVAVFRFPKDPNVYYIKRIIGLPGDTVSFDNGLLSLNGKPVPTKEVTFAAEDVLTEQVYTPVNGKLTPAQAIGMAQSEESGARYYQEKLGEHTYMRRYLAPSMQYEGYSEFLEQPISANSRWQVTVPEGHYFVMGDNTDRSEDGRFWGMVPDENLSGKAVYVWMHKQPGLTNLPTFSYNRPID